jgi:hypothetical protein
MKSIIKVVSNGLMLLAGESRVNNTTGTDNEAIVLNEDTNTEFFKKVKHNSSSSGEIDEEHNKDKPGN